MYGYKKVHATVLGKNPNLLLFNFWERQEAEIEYSTTTVAGKHAPISEKSIRKF